MRVAFRLVALALLAAGGACGGAGAPGRGTEPAGSPPVVPAPAGDGGMEAAALGASSDAAGAGPSTSAASTSDLFARLRDDVAACYEEGRRAIPTMTTGRVTLHMSVAASGATTCVVPSDDTGLTPEVEACMRGRLERERYAPRASGWSAALPLLVKDGTLSLGEVIMEPRTIETVESHGLAEDVYDVVEGILPELYACMVGLEKGAGLRVVYVGGRVAADGHVACALASSASPVPEAARDCLARVVLRARFRPPKKGVGLVSVPLNVLSRK